MIRHIRLLALLAVAIALAGCGGETSPNASATANASTNQAAPARPPQDIERVSLVTDAGTITLALDRRHAPVTTANFLAYVDQHKFDGTNFYRAARTRGAPNHGFIQGGIRHVYTRMLPPIAHEPTSQTGLHHDDGTISMARTTPGSATGDFFIIVGPMRSMDAGGRGEGGASDNLGYAAFGRVVEGMDVVGRILAVPTVPNAGRGAMRGQMITAPVRIVRAARAD
jgi:peptidyl-prolyl cis-trans isomerase A (cyclophilin A)